MSSNERREKEKKEIRNKIFEVATRIILEEGYEKLSMRKIAEQIEYSPTVIYSYFKDKKDIVNQIVFENFCNCMDFIEANLEKNKNETVEIRFQCSILAFVQYMTAHAQPFRAVLLSGGDLAAPYPGEKKTGIEILNALMDEGVALGKFRKQTPYTAEIIVANVFGLIFHMISHKMEDPKKIEGMAMEFSSMILKGIVAEGRKET